LLAIPTPSFGQRLEPVAFGCRVRYQLLLPLWPAATQCRFCPTLMDAFGDHALHCARGPSYCSHSRHHRVRDTLAALFRAHGQAARLEPLFPVQPPAALSVPVAPGAVRGRRADLLLPGWADGRDLYVDVTGASVTSLAALAAQRRGAPAGSAAAGAARRKWEAFRAFAGEQPEDVVFAPFAFETLGGLHEEAVALLERVRGMALQQAGSGGSWVADAATFRRVSFSVAAGVGRTLAVRLPTREPVGPAVVGAAGRSTRTRAAALATRVVSTNDPVDTLRVPLPDALRTGFVPG
jgi:hypothetical protein